MKLHALAAALALSSALVACGQDNDDSPLKSGTVEAPKTAGVSVPAAEPDRNSPPAPTPATHDAEPQSSAPAAPTARDTPAHNPTGNLTAAEEAHSMPKPGQTDNHHTTSLEGDLKGTQQSDGTPPASAVNK